MKFANLKIGTRLIINNIVILVLILVLIGVAFRGIDQLNSTEDDVFASEEKATLATEYLGIVMTNTEAMRAFLSSTDGNEQKIVSDEMLQRSKRSDEIFADLSKRTESADGQALLADMDKTLAVYRNARGKMMSLMEKRDDISTSEAKRLMNAEVAPAMLGFVEATKKYKDRQDQRSKEADDAANRATRVASELMLGIGLTAIILGIILNWVITRSITRPINYAVKIAETVASGDLTQHIEATTKDETGTLLRALRDMNDSLIKTVSHIRTGAEMISSASGQIATGNLDLSARTEEQASSLEETAASTEELASTVKQNADNARQANQLAANASEVATRGGSVVGEVVDTMNTISASSNKISEIVSVIDGIAFQTNILALNAAVEAARAGEQGRGFAVVASEVRTLAQRSANAAKEIKSLIEDSVGKVNIGAEQVQRAGETMQELVSSVKRVADIMGEITAASEEQSAGIEQINRAVSQMDEVTQQNAALVEESAAAASAMQNQAGELVRSVSIFKVASTSQTIDVAATIKKISDTKNSAPRKAVERSKLLTSRLQGNATDSDASWESF